MDVFTTTPVILGPDPMTSTQRDHPIKSDDDARRKSDDNARWKGTAQ